MVKKHKILLQVEWYYPVGGIETFVINLIEVLTKKHEVALLSSYYGYDGRIPEIQKVKNYIVNSSFKKTREAIIDFKPNLIILNNTMPSNYYIVWLSKKHDIPTLYVAHQIPVFTDFGKLSNPINFINWQIRKFYMNRVAKIVTPSLAVQKLIKNKAGKDSIVISNGIDTKRFHPVSESDKRKLRKQYGLPTNKNIILWIGRFSKEKNLNMFIRTAKNDQNKSNRYLIVGFYPASRFTKSTFTRKLLEGLGNSSNIKVINNVSYCKIHEIFQLANIYVSTSIFETLSNTTLEAAACGLTTIVPNHSGIKEAGDDGYLYDYDDHSLFQAIKEAGGKPRSPRVHDNTETGEEYLKIIEELISDN